MTEQISSVPVLTLEDVHLQLNSDAGPVHILRGIDLVVKAGDTVGVIGPSGSGKTSLLMVIAGLERITGGRITAAGTVVDKDDIIDLIHSLDPGYSGQAEFMMNYQTLGDLRKLDTTEGLPIWNGLQENTPSRLYGHPIIVNQDMASVAATSIPILFGDFSTYLIRDVWPIRVTRTTELFWLESQIGLMALARADGNLNDAGTGPIVKMTMPV